MKNTYKILVALASGFAAGAILGALFAPDKGAETRRKINDQGNKLADGIKEKFKKGQEELNGLKENFTQSIKNKIEEFS